MGSAANFPADQLATLVNTDTQRLAARMSQDVFAEIFRLVCSPDQERAGKQQEEIESRCRNWCQAGGDEAGKALRVALLISGLDQWGLAYTQAFRLTAIPALTTLLGTLRNGLDARSEALFQGFFQQIEAVESDAVDFKIELRRNIHLALWHAMTACETAEEAHAILLPLGSMMLALNTTMPELGWRLLADALASIQVSLLNVTDTSPVARDSTQALFESLRQALPTERYQEIMAHSGQVILAWQQARRASAAH